jgi:Na+/proline symporter
MNIVLKTYTTSSSTDPAAVFAMLGLMSLIFVVMFALMGLLTMGIYTKAGQPGWIAFVPIYNRLKLLEIIGRPWWWLLLGMVPIADIVTGIMVLNDLARSFAKDTGYTLGLIFLPVVFFPMLAYGEARYVGPAGAPQVWGHPGGGYVQPQAQFQYANQAPPAQGPSASGYPNQPHAQSPHDPTPPSN